MKKYEEITSRSYDERVRLKTFEEHLSEYFTGKQTEREKLLRILALTNFKRKEKVLDLGCGMGYYAFNLARLKNVQVAAVDYSFDSIKIAIRYKNDLKDLGEKVDVFFNCSDARKLPFRDNQFDKIVNIDFIEHIYHLDKRKVLKEMWRVLKPNGIVITYTPNYNRLLLEYLIQKAKHTLKGKSYGWQRGETDDDHQDTVLHVGLISLNKLRSLFLNAGFIVEKEDYTEYMSLPLLSKIVKKRYLPNLFVANVMILARKKESRSIKGDI